MCFLWLQDLLAYEYSYHIVWLVIFMTLYNKTKKVCGILYSKIFLNNKKNHHDVGLSPVTLTLSVEVSRHLSTVRDFTGQYVITVQVFLLQYWVNLVVTIWRNKGGFFRYREKSCFFIQWNLSKPKILDQVLCSESAAVGLYRLI